MKIALVSPYDFAYPGGVTSHISYLGQQLIANGHQVTILAPSSSPPDATFPFPLIRLGRPVPVPSGGSTARLSFSLWLLPKVQEFLRREQFDIIHLHEPMAPALAPFLPLLVLAQPNAVNVGTFHAYHGRGLVYYATRSFLRSWVRRLQGRIAVSRAAEEFVGRHFPGEYRIIPNGIDLDHFSSNAAPIAQFLDGRVNILFVGRLDKRKGLRYLLGAYSRLKWDYPHLRLLVVGPGNLDKDSYRLLGERNLKDVVFVGGVSQQDLPRYYRTADIYCSPATGKESFGIVLLEAMAVGKPVVASDIPGYNGVLTDGVDGWLVRRKDEAALAEALARLIANPELRQEMGRRGQATARALYSWKRVAGQVTDYYEELLEAQGRHPSPPAARQPLRV